MIYPESIEEKLGFDVIRQRILGYCVSDLGRKLVAEIGFETKSEIINPLLNQVNDFTQLITQGEIPALGSITDIYPYLKKSIVKGNWLNGTELYEILNNVSSALQLADYIGTVSADYISLLHLKPEIAGLSPIDKQLMKSIDKDGMVLSSASSDLKSIRQKMLSEEGTLRKKVNTIFKKAKSDGHVPDGATIGVRDGRMVIPVIAASKRQIQGFVHDESATGNIVFLEPANVLDSNNKIRELQIAEAREIRKILVDLTENVALHQLELELANNFLGRMDQLWAKAKLSIALGAAKAQLSAKKMELKELRHPLLILSDSDKSRKVISHDIALNDDQHIMLISGPNAGGKSVALKSVGLNQMMLQSGILPCCHPDSEFRIFDDIFIDIGDEQSIDNDLSTYSSHLKNMSIMLDGAGVNSLILIDEFGSGTDPTFGGAIAESVLQRLVTNNCFGVITTHFSNLKLYADKTSGMVNAAMVFDLDRLIPLYQLEVGHPGSSFSLEVASQSGLPADIIALAQEGIGANQIDIERLLGNLENEKRKLVEQNEKLAKKDAALSSLQKEYEGLKQKLEVRQKEIINSAKEEASTILSRTNKEIEKTIRHIKENKAEKKETKKIRQSLNKFAEKVIPEVAKKAKNEELVLDGGAIIPGIKVLIQDSGVVAEVLSVSGKKAKVLIGELQSVVSLSKLQKISNRQAKKEKPATSKRSVHQSVTTKMANFSPVLDIRGTRASELLPILQQFLDDAVMLSQDNIKVIHGKGNGVLRQLVRDELKQWPQINKFENEHVERGGDGATVIELK
jgi:DNA mismatch repair protein MutS2